jgi:replicative DNA helicase
LVTSARPWKQIAKDLHIVLLCLVQLNRAVELRSALLDRRPILSDLRASLAAGAQCGFGAVRSPALPQRGHLSPASKLPNPRVRQYTMVIAAKVRDGVSGEVLQPGFALQFHLLLRLAAHVGTAPV